jgi:hypothetical protein
VLRTRLTLLALFAVVFTVFAQTASADPVNAKGANVVTLSCPAPQGLIQVAVNGNGDFTPGHVLGSTALFVPTALNLTFTGTPTGGAPESETQTTAKARQPSNAIECQVPKELNTFTSPEGTFSISGTVSGFFTPAR